MSTIDIVLRTDVKGYYASIDNFRGLSGQVERGLVQTLFWNAVDLERKLEAFQDYNNHSRFHASLEGDTPAQVGGESRTRNADLDCYRWRTHCGGLVQLPVAA